MTLTILGLLIFFTACSGDPKPSVIDPMIEINEVNPGKSTYLTRQNLQQLLKVYDLAPMIFTKKIIIQDGVPSRPFPTPTLNTQFSHDSFALLASFLNLQLHWWIKTRPKKYSPSDQHLIVAFLEIQALKHYVGEEQANKIIKARTQAGGVYLEVYKRFAEIKKIIEINQLTPVLLRQ
jgi:hypothetical protein